MKSFKFSNLCGTVYTGGNLVFSPDGNSILSPVGNRVSVFDLVNNKSITLPVEMRRNIAHIALSPQATILITVDDTGKALLINYVRRTVLHHFDFKEKLNAISFSPDGKLIAVGLGKRLQIWKAPGFNREFAPFVKHNELTGHYDDIVNISWSPDSKHILTSSKDMTARVFSAYPIEGFTPLALTGHMDHVLGAWFSPDMERIYTISRDSAIFQWGYGTRAQVRGEEEEDSDTMNIDELDEEESRRRRMAEKIRWRIQAKHPLKQDFAKVKSCQFFPASELMIVGFANGVFGLYELPTFTNIHSLSITQHKIDTVAVNSTGEWLAFGSSAMGQLLVWEWQSESYVLKQQGHFHTMNALSYSADGQTLATGGEDGKVKVWNTTSGFCFVTFNEHTSGVTCVEFSKYGRTLFSASLDGTVRAFDLVRYRNFRTFTSPQPVQFTSLAVDPSGEIVCAGTLDTFEIYMWNVQTGKLLDILAGHEGPISSLSFSPSGMVLASGSWDRTARLWDVFGRNKHIDPMQHQTEVLAVAYRPDGKQLACSTLDGQIAFWDVEDARQLGFIEGRKDISGGRKIHDRTTSDNASSGKCFSSLCYTADGTAIIGGGSSKYICIYDIDAMILLKKYQISRNLSLDGTQEMLNSKRMTDFGSLDDMNSDEASDLEDRLDRSLPGVQTGDLSKRKTRPEVACKAVRFSPTGRSWSAATTDGLLIYSADDAIDFDPFDLEIDITPDSVMDALKQEEYLRALCMAFRLNEKPVTRSVFEGIPPASIDLVARGLPQKYLHKMLQFLGLQMETSPHVEFDLRWLISLMTSHGRYLHTNRIEFQGAFRTLYKGINRIRDDISNLCDDNTYSLKFLIQQLPSLPA